MLGTSKHSVSTPALTQKLKVSSGLLHATNYHSSLVSSSFNLPHKTAAITLQHLLSSHSDPIKNINGKNKEIFKQRKYKSYMKYQRADQARHSLLHSTRLIPLPSMQHIFFYLHWIKSKNRSLWNEVGLVRTFRIQSQHSRDFQVSSMPKSPSILINLERTDNLSVPRATLLHLSHISEPLQGVHVDPDPQAGWFVSSGMLPILSTGDSQTRP